MYGNIKKVVLDSGLWDGARRQTHGFVLSPDVYEITEAQKEELEKLGHALHECLSGLGRIATIASSMPSLAHTRTWQELGSILRTGIPSHYHDMQVQMPGRMPIICKVDLMRTIDGRYMIAEIDGHNKHGLGYSVLCARMRDVVAPGAKKFMGVARIIADEVRKRGQEQLTLLYAEQERFYVPEFQILANELASLGVKLVVQSEMKLSGKKLAAFANANDRPLFVDFPFLHHNAELNAFLRRGYLEGRIAFLYPPKPFLSSKALLAILRNDNENPELEAILLAFIPADSLAFVRRHIPEAYLISKQKKGSFAHCQELCGGKPYVLKEVISSGMHGTIFADDRNFEKTLKAACGWYNKFILQEEMTNAPHRLAFYTDEGILKNATWFVRIIVLYASHSIADIDVTARQDKRVHGAKDCLQLGTVIVPEKRGEEK